MSESTEIVRREEHGDALSEILGGGDALAMVAQVERNVRAIVDISRQRGFITKFEQVNKKTGEVKVSEFYGLPAWQILGMVYGVTPIVEWVKPVDGGFQARAIAKTRDGSIVGGAEAFCHSKEGGKQYKSDHDLAAVAQGRAERNALRTALGAVLVLAGFDFPDPDAPATNDQIGMLHQLERDIGWTHEQGHIEAGDVASYKDLTREQASELIERWMPLRDEGSDAATGRAAAPASAPEEETGDSQGEGGTTIESSGASQSEPDPSDNEPATKEAWARAPHNMGRVAAIKLAAKMVTAGRIPGPPPKSQAGFTKLQLAKVVGAYRDGERG